jgi:hypothetical protein
MKAVALEIFGCINLAIDFMAPESKDMGLLRREVHPRTQWRVFLMPGVSVLDNQNRSLIQPFSACLQKL